MLSIGRCNKFLLFNLERHNFLQLNSFTHSRMLHVFMVDIGSRATLLRTHTDTHLYWTATRLRASKFLVANQFEKVKWRVEKKRIYEKLKSLAHKLQRMRKRAHSHWLAVNHCGAQYENNRLTADSLTTQIVVYLMEKQNEKEENRCMFATELNWTSNRYTIFWCETLAHRLRGLNRW